MRLLLVEDDPQDIDGLIAQCEVRGWQYRVAHNFLDALRLLSDREAQFHVVVLDMMLPWGEVPNGITERYTDEEAGLRLFEAMRGVEQGKNIVAELGMPTILGRHAQTPVVVLSKIERLEAACRKLDAVDFLGKGDYRFTKLISRIKCAAQAASE
jgi:CheY-like chemotaxis protein